MQKKTNREQIIASYDWYRQMRETQPVSFDQNMQIWNLFRYEDVALVLSDHATFSSEQNRFVPPEYRDVSPISSSIVRMDPPRHHQLRYLVSQAFTPTAFSLSHLISDVQICSHVWGIDHQSSKRL